MIILVEAPELINPRNVARLELEVGQPCFKLLMEKKWLYP
jgi:hypothetical protein